VKIIAKIFGLYHTIVLSLQYQNNTITHNLKTNIMNATYANKETLQTIIENLQSQIDAFYVGEWNAEKSVKEESLVNMISLIAEERNNIEFELSKEEDYATTYINSQN